MSGGRKATGARCGIVNMELHTVEAERKIHELEYDLWSGVRPGLQFACVLEGIPTTKGQPPDYCGGTPAHERRSHTIPANMIKTVNRRSPSVVGFSLKPRVKFGEWNLNVVRRPLYEKTGVNDATVGHNACDFHDGQVFGLIDDLAAVKRAKDDPEIALLFATRAVLMRGFLSFRHWRLFDGRSRGCFEVADSLAERYPDCTCSGGFRRDGHKDARVAKQHEPQVQLLEQEANHLVSLVKNRDFTQVVGKMIFLPGAPGLGGTLVYNQKYGSGVTCTVIPVADGHYVYVTRYKGVRNVFAKAATDLMLPNLDDASKGQLISELALQQNLAMFITMPKWRAMKATGEQAGVREVVEQLCSSPQRKFRALRDDPRVPNLCS